MTQLDWELDFTKLEGALKTLGALTNTAEAHGLMCGFICMGISPENALWREPVLGVPCTEKMIESEAGQYLQTVYDLTYEQLRGFQLDFEPLLPSDESPLTLRTAALAEWCQGLLAGLALSGAQLHQSEEIQEMITELTEIAKVDHAHTENTETEEDAYMELFEHIRLSTVYLHTLLNQPDPSTRIH